MPSLTRPSRFLNGAPSPLNWDDYLRLVVEFTQRPRQGVSPVALTQVLWFGSQAFLAAGDRARAEELWRQLAELGERTRTKRSILFSISVQVVVATMDGDLEGALTAVEHFAARVEELGSPIYGRESAATQARRPLLYLGRAEEAMARRDQSRESTGGQETWQGRTNRVLLLARAGRTVEAQMILDQQLAIVRLDN